MFDIKNRKLTLKDKDGGVIPYSYPKILAALRSKIRIYCFGIKLLVERKIRAFCNNDISNY